MIYLNLSIIATVLFIAGIRILRSEQKGLITRFGKYRYTVNPGFHWVIPFVERLYKLDLTEQKLEAGPLEIITYDKHLTRFNAEVRFMVKADERSHRLFIRCFNSYQWNIYRLAQTALRNIIGTLTLDSAKGQIGIINAEFHKALDIETQSWGIEISGTALIETAHKGESLENQIVFPDSFETALMYY